jgi:hypothetical protein
MEHLVVLIVTGLRVEVAIDGLQCPPGILELHLYFFLLLWVHFLFALSLAGRHVVLALLLHLFMELFCELLKLSALRRAMALRVMHQALHAAVITIGQQTGAFLTSWPPRPPPAAAAAVVGAPASGWLPPAFFFFLLLLLPLLPPRACVPALGWLCPFIAWAEEHKNILDVVGDELLQYLLIPYSLVKCNYHRSIGDIRNDFANLGEPLDEGVQGFPRALLDGMEVGLVARPSISFLEVGRELTTQL